MANESDNYHYVGEELDVFAHAVNWKSYFRSVLRPLLRGTVLEVGAGIGGTTAVLCEEGHKDWLCLEPDAGLADRLRQRVGELGLSVSPRVVCGDLDSLEQTDQFDAIIYIDVLEHIEDHKAELISATRYLREGGALIVLSPAHQYLYTEFDRAIGHYRRYKRAMMEEITPPGLEVERIWYMDAVGMLLSLGNRLLLRSAQPTVKQVKLWDRLFVPCSRLIDPLTGWRLGKSIIAVWRRPLTNAGKSSSE